jgi:hypothetical protein
MKTLTNILSKTYAGQWKSFPCPSDTLEDYNQIIWSTESPPSKEELKGLGVFPTVADRKAAEPIRLLRIDRDQLLAESDWTGLADSAITPEVSAKWKLYRQRLRDLPSGLNTPAKVNAAKWPAKP